MNQKDRSQLRDYVDQLLAFVEANKPDDPFFGTTELSRRTLELCGKLSLPCPVRFFNDWSDSPLASSVWLTAPYHDAGCEFIVRTPEGRAWPGECELSARQGNVGP